MCYYFEQNKIVEKIMYNFSQGTANSSAYVKICVSELNNYMHQVQNPPAQK